MWKCKNAFRYPSIIPCYRVYIWCIHVIDANSSRENFSILCNLHIFQIWDVRHCTSKGFSLLVIISHHKETVVIQNLLHIFIRLIIIKSNCHPFIQKEIRNIFTQLLRHSHTLSPAAFVCSTSTVYLVEREVSDISLIPGYPFRYLSVKGWIHSINPLLFEIIKDIHRPLPPSC